MTKFLLMGSLAAFMSGALMSVPMGMSINGHFSAVWMIPFALIFVAGVAVSAIFVFAPD